MKHFDLTQRTFFGLLSRNLFDSPYVPEDGVDDSRLRRGFQALNRITIIKYPVCKSLPAQPPGKEHPCFVGLS